MIKRELSVSATIYTLNISRQLKLDLKKFNEQYPVIDIVIFSKSQDPAPRTTIYNLQINNDRMNL
jgi:hypothetical protein